MKFTYDTDLSIPKIENKSTECESCATHSHGNWLTARNYRSYRLKDRDVLRKVVDSELRKIETCITFFKEYKNSESVSPHEKAEIAATIKLDEDYADDLRKIRPNACTIS